jgi:hypothetical protein
MTTFNVSLNRRNINTVFYSGLKGTRKDQEEYVKDSLIGHDGYDLGISVRLVGRTTVDEFELQGEYGQGWELITTEKTRKAARNQLKEYRENEGGLYRIVKKRVSI